jgi:aspartyl/asparaginyl beta-hydroxylase (cupin superfamily)
MTIQKVIQSVETKPLRQVENDWDFEPPTAYYWAKELTHWNRQRVCYRMKQQMDKERIAYPIIFNCYLLYYI